MSTYNKMVAINKGHRDNHKHTAFLLNWVSTHMETHPEDCQHIMRELAVPMEGWSEQLARLEKELDSQESEE